MSYFPTSVNNKPDLYAIKSLSNLTTNNLRFEDISNNHPSLDTPLQNNKAPFYNNHPNHYQQSQIHDENNNNP